MDNIFIDTSIFESNNFLESKRIDQILKLGEEKHIQILLPAVTIMKPRQGRLRTFVMQQLGLRKVEKSLECLEMLLLFATDLK